MRTWIVCLATFSLFAFPAIASAEGSHLEPGVGLTFGYYPPGDSSMIGIPYLSGQASVPNHRFAAGLAPFGAPISLDFPFYFRVDLDLGRMNEVLLGYLRPPPPKKAASKPEPCDCTEGEGGWPARNISYDGPGLVLPYVRDVVIIFVPVPMDITSPGAMKIFGPSRPANPRCGDTASVESKSRRVPPDNSLLRTHAAPPALTFGRPTPRRWFTIGSGEVSLNLNGMPEGTIPAFTGLSIPFSCC